MSSQYYQDCEACNVRILVGCELHLPPPNQESPAAFWTRMIGAGRLVEAVALFDRIAAKRAKRADLPRETRAQFLDRVEREGRREKAERVLARLLASGMSRREAQQKLVERFQPVDGKKTQAWVTPDPWLNGRLFRRKKVQQDLIAAASPEGKREAARQAAADQVERARHRQEERVELAEARRIARIFERGARREARSQRAAARAAAASGAAT
jgi:hypothetical protein